MFITQFLHSFIHSSVAEYLDCFHTLTIMKTAGQNMDGQISLQFAGLQFMGYTPRGGPATSHKKPIFHCGGGFNFVFDSGYLHLHC